MSCRYLSSPNAFTLEYRALIALLIQISSEELASDDVAHKSYAHVSPKILLEIVTARTITIILSITYLTFSLAFLFDVRSTVAGYRDNNRKLTAFGCNSYNKSSLAQILDSEDQFGCTNGTETPEPIWIGHIMDLENIIAVSVKLKVLNISLDTFEDHMNGHKFHYSAFLYGCYDSHSCDEWLEVLQMSDKEIDLSEVYDSDEEKLDMTLISNTFQNQEALPTRGIVRSYFVRIAYFLTNSSYSPRSENMEYKFDTIDREKNIVADGLTVALLFLTICFYIWYCNVIYQSSFETEILPEQYWVMFYLAALILFQNPIYCVVCWNDNPKASAVFAYYVLDGLSQTAFYVIWLLFADGLKRKDWTSWFYRPKICFGALIFCSSVVMLSYQFPTVTIGIERNPLLAVYNWSGDTKRVFVGFSVTFLFLLWIWTIWWFFSLYITGQALKKKRYMDTRYLQLSYRFFLLQATLVTLYYIFQYFVIIYFVLTRSSEGWVNELNSVADTINTLFRQQTQQFGKIFFLTVYGVILALLFVPIGYFKYEGQAILEATYVVNEDEIPSLRKSRKRIIESMGKLGVLTSAKVDVLCIDLALELMELSYEAYYDPTGTSTESGFGIMNLERVGYILLDMKYFAPLDTVCFICRNVVKNRVVVMFRGTSSKKHWSSNFDYGKIDVNFPDLVLSDLDQVDELALTDQKNYVDYSTSRKADEYASSDSDDECIYDFDGNFVNRRASKDFRNSSVEKQPKNNTPSFVETTISKANAGVSRAVSYVGNASSSAYDSTVGATATMMIRTAHNTPILRTAFAYSVHRGFWNSYESIREFMHAVLRRELSLNPAEVYFTGHSLGGALATFASVDFSIHSKPRINRYLRWKHWRSDTGVDDGDGQRKMTSPPKITVGMYNYGSPRVGNGNFAVMFDRIIPNAFRMVVDGDIVTGIPPKTSRYKHVGTTVIIDGLGSGSIIVDPSFVERRLQFSTKSSVKAHYINYYREGLLSAKKAAEEIREMNSRKLAGSVSRRNIFLFPSTFRSHEKADKHSSLSSDKNLDVLPITEGNNEKNGTSDSPLSVTPTTKCKDVTPDNERSDLERHGDIEYLKHMETIFPSGGSIRNKTMLGSMRSMLWNHDSNDDRTRESSIPSQDDGSITESPKIKLSKFSSSRR